MGGQGELGRLCCEGAGSGAEQVGQPWEDKVARPSPPENNLVGEAEDLRPWPQLCMRPLCATILRSSPNDKDDDDDDDSDRWCPRAGPDTDMDAGEARPVAKATVEAPAVYGSEEEEVRDDEVEFRGVARVWGSWCFWEAMTGCEITSTLFLERVNESLRPGRGDGAGDG